MRNARVLAAAVLATQLGCLDFDKAREDCVAKGNCLGTLTPVTVVGSSPDNQAVDVAVGSLLGATFSRAMDVGSVKVVIAPAIGLGGLQWEGEETFSVQPTTALAFATQYSVTLTGRSTDGVSLGEDAKFSFTTGAEPDKVAPTLSATSPQAGTQNVPVDFKVVLTFSEAIEPEGLTVMSQPPFLFGTPTWSGDGRTATFAMPNGAMLALTDYVLQIDARDVAGNALTGLKSFSFKTSAPADTTAPLVIGNSPAQGAVDVSVTASPSVAFSEPMNASTVSTAFTVTPAISGGCSVLPDANGSLFTCNHGQALAPSTLYTVTIGTGAKDGAGNALAAAFSFTFTTGIVPDTTAPTVVSTTPLDNASGAVQRPTFTVTFSEPMNQTLTQAAFSIAQPPGVPAGTFTWDASGTVATYTLATGFNFVYGQQVLWQLGAGAKDLAGNALAPQTFNVRIRQLSAPLSVVADTTGTSTTAGSTASGCRPPPPMIFASATILRIEICGRWCRSTSPLRFRRTRTTSSPRRSR